jgi:pyruvate dehydrogenase E1 component alpha subunit
MDVLTVRDKARKVLEKIRSGNGPYFLEVITYRYRGHSMGDPERYRQSEEIKKWQENDPIGILQKTILADKIASQEELEEIDSRVEEEVQAAVQFAESSPDPELSELFKDVYVGEYSD